ncbi:MAG: hypothetical protein WCG50_18655 [Rhodoferax sp.]|uniref:hypothetical protein n=1 Tax=Rhodoferax sp. TaxID=50421 RepID=UPI0030181710
MQLTIAAQDSSVQVVEVVQSFALVTLTASTLATAKVLTIKEQTAARVTVPRGRPPRADFRHGAKTANKGQSGNRAGFGRGDK